MVTDCLVTLSARLYGSLNRINWRAEDVAKVAERFGGRGQAWVASPQRRGSRAEEYKSTGGDEPGKSFTFTISTASVDRHGDSIATGGWDLAAYRKNPVVLWAHDGEQLPVGRATRVWVEGNRLRATAQLASFAGNPNAARVQRLIEGGFLRATSVGFIPLEFAFAKDSKRPYGIDFKKQELLEFSIVAVPANSEALIDPGQVGDKSIGSPKARRERDLDLIRLRDVADAPR